MSRDADVFVGRIGPRRALSSLLGTVSAGTSAVALVAGEPGIGKTRLVAEVTATAAATAPWHVQWAACWEGDGAPAYWPWVQLLRGVVEMAGADDGPARVSAPVRALLDGTRADAQDGAEARFRLFDGVTDLVAGAAHERPLLLVVDDLQWADPASIRLLQFVARDRRVRRCAIIGTYRDTGVDQDDPLTALLADITGDGLHVRLEGLTADEVDALSTAVGGDDLGVPSALLHRRSGGNPFFVRELVRLMSSEPAGRSVRDVVPATIASVVDRRLDGLSAPAVDVLTTAAVLGADLDAAVLADATRRSTAEVAALLDGAGRAGLVEEQTHEAGTPTWHFLHALVREVLYERVDPVDRARRHAAAADALERLYGEDRVTEIAHHRARAVIGGHDDDAAAWAARAAARCRATLAYEDAAGWYARALHLLPAGASEREGELLLHRGECLVAAGDLPAARESFRQAAAVAREDGDTELLAHAALGIGSGAAGFEVPLHDDVQIALLEEALRTIGTAASATRIALLGRLAVALTDTGTDERRHALADDAVLVARDLGDPSALGRALASRCDVIAGPDWCEARRDAATEIVRLAQDAGDVPLELLGRRLRLVALLELGEVGRVDAEIARFARVSDVLRQQLHGWYVPLWRGMRAMMRGDLDAAAHFTAEAEDLGRRIGSDNAYALAFTQAWVRMRHEGRFRDAANALAAAIEPMATAALVPPGELSRLQAIIALQLGDERRAATELRHWAAARLPERAPDSEWLPELAQCAEIASLTGARDVARALLGLLRPYAHLVCVEGIGAAVTGSVAWYVAMLERCVGNDRDADAVLAVARAVHDRIGLMGDPPPLAPPLDAASRGAAAERTSPARRASLVHEGATWAVTFGGTTSRVRDSKGVRDLAVLLDRPDREVHCLELAGGADVGGGTAPELDHRARREYEQRIRDLHDDIEEARRANDVARAELAEDELDRLVQQLAEAFGLSGRARTTGSAAERARSTVTSRIRAAIRHAAEIHPDLGRHLEHSVQTGTWCAYRPETPVEWTIERAVERRERRGPTM